MSHYFFASFYSDMWLLDLISLVALLPLLLWFSLVAFIIIPPFRF